MQAYQIPQGRMCIQIAQGLLESNRNAPAWKQDQSQATYMATYGDLNVNN